MKKELSPIDNVIVKTIKGARKSVSTYKLAKETKLSWQAGEGNEAILVNRELALL